MAQARSSSHWCRISIRVDFRGDCVHYKLVNLACECACWCVQDSMASACSYLRQAAASGENDFQVYQLHESLPMAALWGMDSEASETFQGERFWPQVLKEALQSIAHMLNKAATLLQLLRKHTGAIVPECHVICNVLQSRHAHWCLLLLFVFHFWGLALPSKWVLVVLGPYLSCKWALPLFAFVTIHDINVYIHSQVLLWCGAGKSLLLGSGRTGFIQEELRTNGCLPWGGVQIARNLAWCSISRGSDDETMQKGYRMLQTCVDLDWVNMIH